MNQKSDLFTFLIVGLPRDVTISPKWQYYDCFKIKIGRTSFKMSFI